MSIGPWLLLWLLAVASTDTSGTPPPPAAVGDRLVGIPALALADLEEWQRSVMPTADEDRWLEIPWLASFREGLRRAVNEDKPLLLWVMNGHPLGCT